MGNPLQGRPGFVGYTSGYISSRLNLNTLADQDIRFRFRIGTNSGINDYGWFIDDIRAYTCASPGPTRTPTVTKTPTVTPFGMRSISLPIVLRGGPSPTPTPSPTFTPSPTPTTSPIFTPSPTSPSWEILVSTTFEGDFPGSWDVFDSNPSNGEYYWAARNCRAYPGGNNSGWAVGGGVNGSSLGCGSNYPDNADSWMVYGPFSLVNATDAELNFKMWANTQSSSDLVCRMASINGIDFYGNCYSGYSGGWIDRTLDLTSVFTLGDLRGQSQVWVAIIFNTNSTVNYPEGAYVDNVVLRKCMVPTCQGLNANHQEAGGSQIIDETGKATIQR
jgi:hypothetical protein